MSIPDPFGSLIERSRKAAQLFDSERDARRQLRSRSAYSQVIAVTCMDERCRSFEQDLGVPYGYLRFMRTKGARLQLSHSQVQDTLDDLRRRDDARPVLMLFTAHYSHAHPQHGCAGWNNDVHAAFSHHQRVAEAFGRVSGGFIHTLVCGYETDLGLLVVPHADGSYRAIISMQHDHPFGEKSAYGIGEGAVTSMRDELLRYADLMLRDGRKISPAHHRSSLHSATVMHVGSGFEFDRRSGSAVMVGLHSPTLIDDVALGVEKIIMPEAARQQTDACIVINRLYDPRLDGERLQAAEWVHAVLEDIMCLFRDEVDAKRLRIMTSISTYEGGFEPIMRM